MSGAILVTVDIEISRAGGGGTEKVLHCHFMVIVNRTFVIGPSKKGHCK